MLIIDASRALKKIEKIESELNENVLGAALEGIAEEIAEHMKARLLGDQDGNARTRWREDTTYDKFINSRPYYHEGARQEIADALTVTPVSYRIIDGKKVLWVGIGDLAALNAVALSQPGSSGRYKLWMILEYGTGLYATHPASPKRMIIRSGKVQRFPIREALRGGFSVKRSLIGERVGQFSESGHLVSPSRTRNPGQAGRHFLFDVSGALYNEDRSAVQGLSRIIGNAVSGAGR